MEIKEPTSMKQLIYFTNRRLENDGKIKAWVYRKDCPECGKAKMGKPRNEKTGKPKRRAKKYVCPECGYEESKKEHEESLDIEIKYKCPHCGHEDMTTTNYKRSSFYGVKAYVFKCDECNERIGITKKMKKPKKKKKKK